MIITPKVFQWISINLQNSAITQQISSHMTLICLTVTFLLNVVLTLVSFFFYISSLLYWISRIFPSFPIERHSFRGRTGKL